MAWGMCLAAIWLSFEPPTPQAPPGRPTDDPRFFSPGSPRAAWIGVDVRF